MPNILLVIVVLANIFFMGLYIRNNGAGAFLSTTGVVFLVLGIVIFIFFLSIDPGYGWIRSIDLTRNYIMIFASMAVCMAGVVLIVVGQHLNELYVQSLNAEKRCRQLKAGNVVDVLKKDWYSLRDKKSRHPLKVYLFQKKSDRNSYKIVAAVDQPESGMTISNLTISSTAMPQSSPVSKADSACPGIIEKNISIDFARHQVHNEQVWFNLSIVLSGESDRETGKIGRQNTIRFSLKNSATETGKGSVPRTQAGKWPQLLPVNLGTSGVHHGHT